MGGTQSTPLVPGGGSEGFHVLKVWPNSPGHIAGLEPFFDFIIGVNEFRLDIDGDQLKQVTAKNVDKEVKLTVYNSKNQDVRELTMIPTNTWGGKGLLGLSIRYCSFEGASENVWHILNVAPNSPASAAGLQSNLDYIIAADSLPLDERDDLFGLIESHNNSQLKLYVYNVITDVCREVLITPSTEWGGEGCLGCGIGYGYLHRLPKAADRQLILDANTHLSAQAQAARSTIPTQQQMQMQMQIPVPMAAPMPAQPAASVHGHSHGGVACNHGHGHGHGQAPPPVASPAIMSPQQTMSPSAAISQMQMPPSGYTASPLAPPASYGAAPAGPVDGFANISLSSAASPAPFSATAGVAVAAGTPLNPAAGALTSPVVSPIPPVAPVAPAVTAVAPPAVYAQPATIPATFSPMGSSGTPVATVAAPVVTPTLAPVPVEATPALPAGVDHGAYMAFLQQQQQQQQAAQAAFLAQMGGGQPATGTVIPGYAAPVSPAPAN